MVKIKGEFEVCDLPTDCCAFMVAVVQVRLVVTEEEIEIQFTSEGLSKILKLLPQSRAESDIQSDSTQVQRLPVVKFQVSGTRCVHSIIIFRTGL